MSLAGILAVLHTLIGIVVGAVIALGALLNQEGEGLWSLGIWAILVLPVVNAMIGYGTGLLIAFFYNLMAQGLNQGIEMEFERTDSVSLNT